MPNVALLKRIFELGLKGVSKEELEQLFRGRGKLYRMERKPERLLEEGLNPEVLSKKYKHDYPGIYYGTNKSDMAHRYSGESMVEGLKRPGSMTRNIPGNDYDAWMLRNKDSNKFSKNMHGADFLQRVDTEYPETIQLKPGNILARIKTKKDWVYKILGLIAAMEAMDKERGE